MKIEIENYKQRLFEVAAEYGKAGRLAYHELDLHIDEALENQLKPNQIIDELGEPEQAIRKILKADGKSTYPLNKIVATGVLIALGLGILAGLSGLLMPLGSKIGGMTAISGDPPNLPYTAARCVEFRQLVPSAANCREAAMLHHYYELTDGRVVFALFLLICLSLFAYAARRSWITLLPKKITLLLTASIYIAVGGLVIMLALGNLSAGRSWQWLGDLLTGIPIFLAGMLVLFYYLGYITSPSKKIRRA